MTEFTRDERKPLESYTFTYTEQEMKSLRNELDKSSIVKLIVLLAIILVLIIHSIIVNPESQILGFSFAMFLYVGTILLIRFKQRKYLAQKSDKRVAQSVYLYEFFDDCLRVTVHRNGVFSSCSYIEFSDIERYWNTKEYYAFTAGSLLYLVRKSALCENSRVPEFVCRSNLQKTPENTETQGSERVIPEELKTLDRMAFAFLVASFAVPVVIILIVAFLIVNYGMNAFVAGTGFLLCTLIAVSSVIAGFVLRSKGINRVRNIVSGIILAFIFFCFTYLFFMI